MCKIYGAENSQIGGVDSVSIGFNEKSCIFFHSAITDRTPLIRN